jgi:IclR family acetate operon transcriptional repressor
MHPKEKYVTPNLRNACRILKRLSEFPGGLDLGSISRDMKVPRTTVLRICTTLELESLLGRTAEGRYVLGSGLAPLGIRALPNSSLREMAVPILSQLAARTGETAHLAVLCDKKSLLLEVCDSPNPLRVASRPGSLALIHCSATGKVFLAYAVHGPLEKFFAGMELESRTSNTITDVKTLEKEVKRVRSRGYAVDNEEYYLGVRCVGAPVRDAQSHVVASVGITGAAVRFPVSLVKTHAQAVLEGAARLSKALQQSQVVGAPPMHAVGTGSE